MFLLKLLMFTLTFYELVVNLDASGRKCKKGERVEETPRGSSQCKPCHEGNYQVEENSSKRCHGACTTCDESSGSFTQKRCTTVSNAECQCRRGFVPSDSDSSTCKCDIGFGLTTNNGRKDCLKCEHGYFNAHIDSTCKKWKECPPARVITPGTTTSDVICNNTYATTTHAPTKIISTRLTLQRPQEGTKNQKMHTTTTTTTTTSSASGHTVPPKGTVMPSHPGNHIGMALLIFGIAGLLVLSAVTCKLHITPYLEKQPPKPNNESCRRPVEESGDGSQSVPLKLEP